MASEPHKCKAQLSITDIEEAEAKQNACGTYFVDIHDILKREIKEEATESKPFSEYGVSNECLEKHENEIFIDQNSSESDVMSRNRVEDPKESKFTTTHFWGNTNSNGLADEFAKPKVNHFENGVTIKIEDHSECTDNSSTNSAEWKTEALKTENIDLIYEDVKPQICEEKSSEKSEHESCPNSVGDISIGTETKPRIRRKLTKDQSRNPKCDKCKKPFRHLKNLWNHKKYTCGEGPVFQCLVCNLSSKYIQNVQKHMFLKHDTMLSRGELCKQNMLKDF